MKPIDKLGLGPKRESVETEKGWLATVTPPVWSGFTASSIILTEDQHERYLKWLRDGGMIQHMLPELSADQREVLLSGIGAEDFEAMAQEQEEDWGV